MNYSFDAVTYKRYGTIKAILNILFYSPFISLVALIVWSDPSRWTVYFKIPYFIIYPCAVIGSSIFHYFRERKLAKKSLLHLPEDDAGSANLHLCSNMYDMDYRINTISRLRRTWWGIIVHGNISADHSYNPEMGVACSKSKTRLVMPPHFSDMEGIAQKLSEMISAPERTE